MEAATKTSNTSTTYNKTEFESRTCWLPRRHDDLDDVTLLAMLASRRQSLLSAGSEATQQSSHATTQEFYVVQFFIT